MAWAVSGFLVLAVAAVFGQTLGYGFVNFDDGPYVYENGVVQRGLTWEGFRWALTYGEIGHWHPLTWLTHMLDSEVYGLKAWGHHFTNVLLHGGSAILLFWVLRGMTGSLWRSAFVAAVFAVHPLRAESVAWVSERKDVLSGLFFMLTLMLYVRYVGCPRSWFRWGAVVLFFGLGLLSKNMLVTLPFVLLLLDYWPLGRMSGRDFRGWLGLVWEKWPLFALTAGSCVMTLLVPEEVSVGDRLSLGMRLENAAVSYAVYLWQMVYPFGLACFYPNPAGHWAIWQVAGSVMLLAGISWGVWVYRRRHPYLVVGWLWYLGMMVPVIGIVQISYYAHADRYTYLPQIGLLIAVTWGMATAAASWRYRRPALGVASVLAVLLLMALGWRQTSYWRDSESLWSHALASTERNHVAHMNLGKALKERGQTDDAVAHFRKVLEIKPGNAEAYNNIGVVLAESRQVDAAIDHYRKALEIKPDYIEAHNSIGMALAGRGEIEAAVAHFRKALDINPVYVEARNNLGNALMGQGKIDEAIDHYRKALEIRPDYAKGYNNLGIALARHGQVDAAIAHFRKALEIRPDYGAARGNLYRALQQQGPYRGARSPQAPP